MQMQLDQSTSTAPTKTPGKGITYGRLRQCHPRLDLGRIRMLHALYRGGNHLLSDTAVMDFVFGKIGDESDTVYNERRRRAFYENVFAMVINQISAGLAQDPCRLIQPEAPLPDLPDPNAPDAKKPSPFGAPKKPNPFAPKDEESDKEETDTEDPFEAKKDAPFAADGEEDDDEEPADDYFEDPEQGPPQAPVPPKAPIIDEYWTELMKNATVRHEDGGSERTFDQVMRDICVEALTCGWAWYQVDLPKPTYLVGQVEVDADEAVKDPKGKKPELDEEEDDEEEDQDEEDQDEEDKEPEKDDTEEPEEDDEEPVASISLKDQEDAGDLNAYIATWPTDAITDWEEVDGRVLWVRTYEVINVAPTPEAPRFPQEGGQRIHRWTVWDTEGWRRYDIVETKDEPLSKWNEQSIVPVADEDTHTFGRVPWIRFDLCTPGTYLHVGDLIESLCRSYFNRTNGESWQWMQACFQQLYEFLAPEMAGIDAPISSAQQDPARAKRQRRAPGVVHERGDGDRAEYIAPNMSGADVGKAATQELRDAILRVTSQMALAQDTSGAMLRRSADSKKQDSVAQEIVMGAVGKRLLINANQALKLCAIARGDDPEKNPELAGYTRFQVDDATTLITDAVTIDSLAIPSATFKTEMQFRVASAHLGDDVSPEKLERIRLELEQANTQDQMTTQPNPFGSDDQGNEHFDADGNPIPVDGSPVPGQEPDVEGGAPPPFGGKPKKKGFGGPPWMKKGKGATARKAPAPGHQEKPWSCGPASLVNICSALGLDVTEKRVREYSDADKDGTDEKQLMDAARELGLKHEVISSAELDRAWDRLHDAVSDGMPALLCVDQWDHWVAVVGVNGDRVIMLDPSNEKDNVAVNGVHMLTKSQLSKRWKHKEADRAFYAISFSR